MSNDVANGYNDDLSVCLSINVYVYVSVFIFLSLRYSIDAIVNTYTQWHILTSDPLFVLYCTLPTLEQYDNSNILVRLIPYVTSYGDCTLRHTTALLPIFRPSDSFQTFFLRQ